GDLVTSELNNCFSGNTFTSTAPVDLEALAPCDGEGNGGDFTNGELNLGVLIAEMPEKPAKDSYKTTPVPEDQETMPGDLEAPHVRFEAPEKPDVDAITVPAKPS